MSEEIKKPESLGSYQQFADEIPQDSNGEISAAQEVAPVVPTSELIKPIIEFGVAVLCPNWDEVKKQSDLLAGAYADLLDKYFPNAIGSFGPELNALLITAAVFGPSVMSGKPRVKPDEKKAGDQVPAQVSAGDD